MDTVEQQASSAVARQEEVVATKAESTLVAQGPVADGVHFNVKLVKTPGVRLGVDVDLSEGSVLIVDKVSAGLMDEWNKANPSKVVRRGDRFLAVNGQRGNSQRLTEECRSADVLEIVVQRP